MLDPPDVIRRKIKRAVTDSGTEVRYDPEPPGIANLLTLHATLTGEPMAETEAHFAGKGYGDLKTELAELVIATLEPVQKRYQEVMADKGYLEQVLTRGAEGARSRARKTISKVYRKVRLVPLR